MRYATRSPASDGRHVVPAWRPSRRACTRRARPLCPPRPLTPRPDATGEQLGTLNHIPVHCGYQQILWASPSAHLLIVSGTQPGPTIGPFNLGHSAAIQSDGRITPIPWSNRTFAAAW